MENEAHLLNGDGSRIIKWLTKSENRKIKLLIKNLWVSGTFLSDTDDILLPGLLVITQILK